MLEERFGPFQTEARVKDLLVPGLRDRQGMDPVLKRILTAIERCRKRSVSGRQGYNLAFDFFSPTLRLAIEFDERQHFTLPRASSLKAYPLNLSQGFDRGRWIAMCGKIQAGDNDPVYRDEQRAFYDAIRDVVAPRLGLLPVVRIYEEDVKWEQAREDKEEARKARQMLDSIQRFVRQHTLSKHEP